MQFCPLWSTTLRPREAFVRLAGELSTRITAVNRPETPSKRPVRVEFRGDTYQVVVFHGTMACTYSEKKLGEEMMALLARGVTDAGVADLLSRWSLPAPPGALFQEQMVGMDGAASSSGAAA